MFEHVLFPLDTAFENMNKILKDTGFCIFSVPYNSMGNTVEHFPSLYNYSVERLGESWVLTNHRKDGVTETFDNLCFHGGEGQNLEMRRFSLPDLKNHFKNAGFKDLHVHDKDIPEFGIIHEAKDSFIITARKVIA